jgi:Domain of unknown function (DUF4129)
MIKLQVTRIWFPLILLALVFFSAPMDIVAIPLSDYHQNLQRAITALDSLAQSDEDEDQTSYEGRLTETVSGVRRLIPEKQSVESGSSVWEVDNSWLHKKLDEFEAQEPSERDDLRTQLIQSLQTIEERVGEFEKASVVENSSKEESNKRLEGILSRSEYGEQSGQGSAMARLINRFVRWLSQFLPRISPMNPSKGSPLTVLAQFVVVALAAAVIVYVLIKLARHFGKRSHKVKPKKKKEARIVLGERLEPEASASDLLTEAEALARNGEIRAAIRKTYIALLVELGDRKVISLAQHKTNRDYLRSVSSNPSLYGNMRGLTDSFERHWYGFAESSAGDWQTFKAAYLAALRTNV